LEKLSCFSFAKNTPFFTLFVSTSLLFFLELHLVFDFCLDIRSDLVISFHQGVFFSSGLYWFSSKELAKKSLNGVGKKKKLYAKKWYKKELV
jgi:hypothetical protein